MVGSDKKTGLRDEFRTLFITGLISVCKLTFNNFSLASGIESKKVCIGVLPKQYLPVVATI
jgi:hypothetical protein